MELSSEKRIEVQEYFEQKWTVFWLKYMESFIHGTSSMGKYDEAEKIKIKKLWYSQWKDKLGNRGIQHDPDSNINVPTYDSPKDFDFEKFIKILVFNQILEIIRGRENTEAFYYKASVDEYLFILNLFVLQVNKDKRAFQKTSIEKSRRSYLKKGSEAYKIFMKFCQQLLNNKKLTVYSVVNSYVKDNPNCERPAKSLENSFRAFLKNHKSEILQELKIDESRFDERFINK
jgi:hypothetical protein